MGYERWGGCGETKDKRVDGISKVLALKLYGLRQGEQARKVVSVEGASAVRDAT